MNILSLTGVFLIAIAGHFFFQKSPEESSRDEWLLKYFGKEGMKRWLITAKLSGELKDWDAWYIRWNCLRKPTQGWTYRKYMRVLRAVEKSKAKYGEHCFDAPCIANGVFSGLVMTGSWDYFWKNENPPWDRYDYEPRGADWIAAGYVNKFTLSNGVVVDPLSKYVGKEGGKVFGY